MIKFKFEPITNPKTGKTKDIVVNALSRKNVKDTLIGSGIVMVGITYIALSAFKNGAYAYDLAEYKTLEELDLLMR